MFKGSEGMTTKGIKNWPVSTNPLSICTSSHENPSEHQHKTYTARN